MSPEGTIVPGELRILGQRETQRKPIVVRFSKVLLNETKLTPFSSLLKWYEWIIVYVFMLRSRREWLMCSKSIPVLVSHNRTLLTFIDTRTSSLTDYSIIQTWNLKRKTCNSPNAWQCYLVCSLYKFSQDGFLKIGLL